MIDTIQITIQLPPSLLRPPNNAEKKKLCMIIDAIMAIKLAIVIVRMSRFFTCDSSWARTASSSLGDRRRIIESVQQTTACFGFRPVANAFGTGLCIMAIFGRGRSASLQSFSTIIWSSGYSSPSITRAPVDQSTILSEKKYWTSPIPTARMTNNQILALGNTTISIVMNTR